MSNRRKLRLSICQAVDSQGRPLVKRAVFRDPGAYVPSPPHPVRQPAQPKRNRPPSGEPLDQYDRFARYAGQTARSAPGRPLLTPGQYRRWLHKLHAHLRKLAARKDPR